MFLKPWDSLRCSRCGHTFDSHTHMRRGHDCALCLCDVFAWTPIFDIPIYWLGMLKVRMLLKRAFKELENDEFSFNPVKFSERAQIVPDNPPRVCGPCFQDECQLCENSPEKPCLCTHESAWL